MRRLNIDSKSLGAKYFLEMPASEIAAYLKMCEETGKWGRPARTETRVVTPAVVDEVTGEIITPAVTEQVQIPAEYTIEVVDITSEVQAQETARQALVTARNALDAIQNKNTATTAELLVMVKGLARLVAVLAKNIG